MRGTNVMLLTPIFSTILPSFHLVQADEMGRRVIRTQTDVSGRLAPKYDQRCELRNQGRVERW